MRKLLAFLAIAFSCLQVQAQTALFAATGHWSAPIPIWAKNPATLRRYQTQAYYWIDAAKPQLEEPVRRWPA